MDGTSKKSSAYQSTQDDYGDPPPAYESVTKKPWWKNPFRWNRRVQHASAYPSGASSSHHAPLAESNPEDDPEDDLEDDPEDELHLLAAYDTVFVLDDSTSMRGSRWAEASRALQDLVKVAAKYDEDGIDLTFLHSNKLRKHIKEPDQVREIFDQVRLRGSTPTAKRLGELLAAYVQELRDARAQGPQARQEIKPVNYIVITDGRPTDDPAAEISQAARWLEELHCPLAQVGIQFIQIGDDPGATQALIALDDELKNTHRIRDMVDTTPYQGELTGDFLIKGLLGGINRRWDKESNPHSRRRRNQRKS